MQQDLLAKVVSALEAAGVPHMVTGSFASTLHGEAATPPDPYSGRISATFSDRSGHIG